MISVNYQKRKNLELFQQFKKPELLFLSNPQNYIPIYKRFFQLNNTNYNNVNLNNKWFLSSIRAKVYDDCDNIYKCQLVNAKSSKDEERNVFFKLAPLLDPFKFLTGSYTADDKSIYELPKLKSEEENCLPKFLCVNNSAYVDSFFLYLSNQLKHHHNFIHGIEYYGSYLGNKHNYRINIADDIEFLINSEYFNKNKDKLFSVDNYDHLFSSEQQHKPTLVIGNNISLKSCHSVNNDIFDGVFEDDDDTVAPTSIDLNDLKDMSMELMDVIHTPQDQQHVTLKSSGSSCSSRSSYTNDDIDESCEHCGGDDNESMIDNDAIESVIDNEDMIKSETDKDENIIEEDDDTEDDDYDDDIYVYATIPKFPVQVIAMECCGKTFNHLILNTDSLSDEEFFSAFMQIIMTLIVYQDAFHFTHNDLHTSNIMYDVTDKKYLYYCYKNTYYKVPTFGRLYKIIDFGRSIYKFNNKIFCSDSFQAGGDAASQYNTEPYFNNKKPRLEPNYSFDLCRLACSIYDYVVTDDDKQGPVGSLIRDWVMDDKGLNMLYKTNGDVRYYDFKLYKMIARCVHRHTPHAQLERPEFASYKVSAPDTYKDVIYMDIIPCYALS